MEDVTIRAATESDLAAIVRLIAEDSLGAGRETVSDPPARCYAEALAAIDADPRNEFLVAERDGAVVGCLQLTYIPGLSRRGSERAQIESVRVARALRGQGLGRHLFRWAIERARDRGCALVQLTTDRSREDAHGFYESLGFEPSHVGMKLAL